MNETNVIPNALKLPNGARFYRCAFQVNPYSNLTKNGKQTPFTDEDSYNTAIVQECKNLQIEAIAITDHYCVDTTIKLAEKAKEAGIFVFPAFEAVSKEGVHILCLFDSDTKFQKLERLIGDCGIHDDAEPSPVGKYSVEDLLGIATNKWGAVCIAAHVAGNGGLLRTMTGKPRVRAWRSPNLLVCSLAGPVSDAPDDIRKILENKDAEYKREFPVTIINAQDINNPEDLVTRGTSCWIKMTSISVEGLRQAFLDPSSRVRLATDPIPEKHVEVVALAWEGGFLDGQAIHFNENLNVLIGGRGTGKSTIIESLRYALDLHPLGDDAQEAHDGIVRNVLRNGTKISVFVRSYTPAHSEYVIERTVPNPPVVRDDGLQLLNLRPQDVIPNVEVYGQHEIAELARSPEKMVRLLERFLQRDETFALRKIEMTRELDQSRIKILDILMEMKQSEERLATLPSLEETLQRYQQAGIEDRLKEQSLLVREERVLKSVQERVGPFRIILEDLRRETPVDRTFLSTKALEGLPNEPILQQADQVIHNLSQAVEDATENIAHAIEQAEKDLVEVHRQWELRRVATQEVYEQALRDLQKTKVDGEEFIRLRRQVEDLHPLRERQSLLKRDLEELRKRRRNLLADWEELKRQEFHRLDQAAKSVNHQLKGKVRVQVTAAGNRQPLLDFLRENIPGRLAEAFETLRTFEHLSLPDLATAFDQGIDSLENLFGIHHAQAERLAQASPEVILQLEELDLPPTAQIELNIAAEKQSAYWQSLDDLSTGQKATALLLLLLLKSDAPLIIDQPEDDLDNRFVTEGIVPKMREEKRQRQFIFCTHNANIPVLGDAELILGLQASGEAGQGYAQIPSNLMGSIDSKPVRQLVEDLLEGGRVAFETRRLKYGF